MLDELDSERGSEPAFSVMTVSKLLTGFCSMGSFC